jgi:hypothetical protein
VKDLTVHLALFLVIATAIVTLGVFYSEGDDRAARAAWPRRMGTFLLGCAVLVAVMLVCEHTFASLD